MTPAERAALRIHARSGAFLRKLERTRAIIRDALATPLGEGRIWYVAYSGGVDSTVMLDLVWEHAPQIPMLWGDDGFDLPETLVFLDETEARLRQHIIRVRSLNPWRDWCHEMERPDLAEDPAAFAVWGNPRVWDHEWRSLTQDAPLHGYGGVFLGLLGHRWQHGGESTGRAMQLRGGTRPLYQVAAEGGIWHCSPLADWTKRDVWAYVAGRDIAYNAAYDVQARLGVPIERRRIAPSTCFRAMDQGTHAMLRRGWPTLWNEIVALFPAVKRYG
jgi:phosphoadenosine phosphosulfate reductase